jgi:hypothetical protein
LPARFARSPNRLIFNRFLDEGARADGLCFGEEFQRLGRRASQLATAPRARPRWRAFTSAAPGCWRSSRPPSRPC